jgi:hypothetical protein
MSRSVQYLSLHGVFIDVRDQKGSRQSNLGQFPRRAGTRAFSSFYPSNWPDYWAECLHPGTSLALLVSSAISPQFSLATRDECGG